MLHVFQIDAGRMLNFDIAYAAETVATLQEALAQSVHAPASEQILLISGGEVLDNPERRISRYSAGTDSNPIFLVCRPSGDLSRSSYGLSCSPTPDFVNILEIENQISHASQSPPTFQTIQLCVQQARRLVQAADANVDRCGQLVSDQHLLHQGWLAVIANLDDTVTAFRQRLIKFKDKIEKFSSQRQQAIELLSAFEADVHLLKRIPILSCLLSNLDTSQSQFSAAGISLFDWISSKEPEHSLQDLAADARQALDRLLDPRVLEHLSTLEAATLDRAQDVAMKEIGGLGKRLARLDEYLQHVKKLQLEQRQYAESLRAQEQRAATVNDSSIVADLCLNHLSALRKMVDRQKQLADVTRRFCDAKAELLKNIHIRMRWVAETHQLIQTGDSKAMLNGERLYRLRRQLELLKQFHDAPFVYASAVTEVVRRKAFSQEFIAWSDRLSDKSKQLCADENRLRDVFAEKFDNHFLRTLFPGMEERTPDFANEPPEPFDIRLPPIDVDHVRELRCVVPQLQHLLYVQNPNVYERVFISSTRQPSSAPLQRDASFFSQAPPKYAAGASAGRVSGSAPVIIRTGNNVFRPSPSWFAGEMEFSPTDAGACRQDDTFLASVPLAVAAGTRSDSDDAGIKTAGIYDSDSEIAGNELDSEPSMSNGRTNRSAPIRIPSNQRTNDDIAGAMISSSRGQLSEKDLSSCKFATPDEHMMPGSMDERQHKKSISKRSPILTLAVSTQCSTILQFPSEEEALRRDLTDKTQRLIEAANCEELLRRQLCDRDTEIDRYRTMLSNKVLPELVELRQFFGDARRAFVELTSSSEKSKSEWTEVLEKAARQLEDNLQAALEEARKAEDELRKRETDSSLEELRRQLDEERTSARENQKQLANSEAFLKQKDEVIELLQQRLQEQEANCAKQVEEAKAELMKRLLIEQELTADSVRADYEREIEIKENEIQQLKQELAEKQQVLRDMKREQDSLVANMCDREVVCDFINKATSPNSEHQRSEEILETLRQVKSDLEREYKDKLQMLTAGLEAKHAQQLERVRKEKEVELRMMKLQLEKNQDGKAAEDVVETASTSLEAWRSAQYASDAVMTASRLATVSTVILSEDSVEHDECAEAEQEEEDSEQQSPQKERHSPDDTSAVCPEMSAAQRVVATKSRAVQTKEHNGMKISILRISRGDLVLLVFDPQFNTFVIFTVSPTLYILKESCLQRMGCPQRNTAGQTATLSTGAEASSTVDSMFPKQRWILGRVVEWDYCQIKKPKNRYGLPVNTRFYRVATEPVIIKPQT